MVAAALQPPDRDSAATPIVGSALYAVESPAAGGNKYDKDHRTFTETSIRTSNGAYTAAEQANSVSTSGQRALTTRRPFVHQLERDGALVWSHGSQFTQVAAATELDGAQVTGGDFHFVRCSTPPQRWKHRSDFNCTLDPLTPWVPNPCGPGPLSEGMSDGWLAADRPGPL